LKHGLIWVPSAKNLPSVSPGEQVLFSFWKGPKRGFAPLAILALRARAAEEADLGGGECYGRIPEPLLPEFRRARSGKMNQTGHGYPPSINPSFGALCVTVIDPLEDLWMGMDEEWEHNPHAVRTSQLFGASPGLVENHLNPFLPQLLMAPKLPNKWWPSPY
jgi:hypothetical protein